MSDDSYNGLILPGYIDSSSKKNITSRAIKEETKDALRNNDELSKAVFAYLSPNGLTGSKYFDQSEASRLVSEAIDLHGKYPDVTLHRMFQLLQAAMKEMGYVFGNGRLVSDENTKRIQANGK